MIRTFLVPASGSDTDASVFATALALAKPFAAHLLFFHVHLPPGEAALHAPHVDFARGAAITEALDFLRRQGNTLAANAFVNCQKFCAAHEVCFEDSPSAKQDVSASWIEETSNARARLMFHARHSDAVVLGRTRNRDFLPDGLIERWHGINAEVRVHRELPGRPSAQLQQAAAQAGADLLVIGGFGHGPFREHLFGGVTQTLIDAATLPIFMLH